MNRSTRVSALPNFCVLFQIRLVQNKSWWQDRIFRSLWNKGRSPPRARSSGAYEGVISRQQSLLDQRKDSEASRIPDALLRGTQLFRWNGTMDWWLRILSWSWFRLSRGVVPWGTLITVHTLGISEASWIPDHRQEFDCSMFWKEGRSDLAPSDGLMTEDTLLKLVSVQTFVEGTKSTENYAYCHVHIDCCWTVVCYFGGLYNV